MGLPPLDLGVRFGCCKPPACGPWSGLPQALTLGAQSCPEPKVSVDTPRTYLGHPVPPGPLLRRQDRDLSTQQSAQTSDRADQAARPCPPLGHIHTSPASSVPMRSEAEGKHTTPAQTEQRKPVLPRERPAVAGEGLQATGMLCWGHIPGSEQEALRPTPPTPREEPVLRSPWNRPLKPPLPPDPDPKEHITLSYDVGRRRMQPGDAGTVSHHGSQWESASLSSSLSSLLTVSGERSLGLYAATSPRISLLNRSRAASGAKLQQTKRGSVIHGIIWCFELTAFLDYLLFITGEGDSPIAVTI